MDSFDSLSLSLSLVICSEMSSFLVCILDSIMYSHRTDECNFFASRLTPINPHNPVYQFNFTYQQYPACLPRLKSFARWEVSINTNAVLWGVISRICSKQHASSLYSYYLAFSPSVLQESKWCNLIIVLTCLQRFIFNWFHTKKAKRKQNHVETITSQII